MSDTKAVDLDADGRFLYLALPIRPSLVYHRDLMTRHGFPTSYCPFYLSLPASFSSFPYTAVPTLNEPTLLLPPALSSRAPLRNQTLMHRDSIFDAWLMFPDRLMDCALPSISDVHPANLRNFAPLRVYGILRHTVLQCAATPDFVATALRLPYIVGAHGASSRTSFGGLPRTWRNMTRHSHMLEPTAA